MQTACLHAGQAPACTADPSPTPASLPADNVIIPTLCGKQWDVTGYWVNRAGASNPTAGPRITMPACPFCTFTGSSCNVFSAPCCDLGAQCVRTFGFQHVCGKPPNNPTAPGSVTLGPTNTTSIAVTLAPALSNGGISGGLSYRAVLTQVGASPVVTVTKTGPDPTVVFVAGQAADGEADGGWAAPLTPAFAPCLQCFPDPCYTCWLALVLSAGGAVIPVLCGKQWNVQGIWVNAAGASSPTGGLRVTMPACPSCVATGETCLNSALTPCCDRNATCVFLGGFFPRASCVLPP